ncbi:MAG: hypothetical protein ACNFW9_02615 [Candidatus Kerfeldbacteria bacterium]
MKISEVIEKLTQIQDQEGDIEVTCTGSTLPDGHGGVVPDVFESTAENFQVGDHKTIGKRVRIIM